MPERSDVLVTNTTPLISLAAATGSLEILRFLYRHVVVPHEVAEEVRAGARPRHLAQRPRGAIRADALMQAQRQTALFITSTPFGPCEAAGEEIAPLLIATTAGIH